MANELDTEIQILLNKIQIAHEGHIITSEYHNSLRDALMAIAKRMNVTVKPVSNWRVFTYAPNFLPINQRQAQQFDWKVTFNKAIVPEQAQTIGGDNVRGAFTIQLPDDTQIKKMAVRGERLGDEVNPKEFSVFLNRIEIDNPKPKPETLIAFDLKKHDGGFFSLTQSIKNPGLGQVDNIKYSYSISAVWENSTRSDRFQINSIQVFCDSEK